VFSVLDKDSGNAEVGDRDDIPRITAASGRTPDGVRGRDNLVPDNVRAPAAPDQDQRAGDSAQLKPDDTTHSPYAVSTQAEFLE
jgi:hypothetical protein